jgi:N-acyl-D-amino-acid deacylase
MDLVIKNALLFDGSGDRPRAQCSVGVKDGRIVAVGDDVAVEPSIGIIDADGLALMPGIIDSHTHYDAQVTWDPSLDPSPSLGVTTVVMGNCGFTIAPCRPEDRDLIMRNLTQVEGMSLDALRAGIEWNFESFPAYLDGIELSGTMPNVAAFIGHSALRTYVMKEAAVERPANDDELSQMRGIVSEAMAAGAIGFATSTAPQHNGAGGIPMPSRLADDEELETLIKAMGEGGKGVFMLTKGDRTDVPYLEALAAKTGRPFMIAALLHNPTNPDGTFADLRGIAAARENGHQLWGQVSCCPLTMDFTMHSAYPLESFKSWAPAMKVQGEDLKAVYQDNSFRDAVRAELATPAGVRLFNGEWDKIEITQVVKPENAAFEHRSVAELAHQANADPLDWMLDFAVEENLETVFTAVLLNSDEDAVGRMITDPNASVALSDAGAHLTFFCDAGFGLHLMGHWVRRLEVLTLEQAVHELTGKPAAIYGIQQRGRIEPGCWADMLLFDPATVDRGAKRRQFDLPTGAARLITDQVGVHGVWINGQRIADENGIRDKSARPGRLLREFDA